MNTLALSHWGVFILWSIQFPAVHPFTSFPAVDNKLKHCCLKLNRIFYSNPRTTVLDTPLSHRDGSNLLLNKIKSWIMKMTLITHIIHCNTCWFLMIINDATFILRILMLQVRCVGNLKCTETSGSSLFLKFMPFIFLLFTFFLVLKISSSDHDY